MSMTVIPRDAIDVGNMGARIHVASTIGDAERVAELRAWLDSERVAEWRVESRSDGRPTLVREWEFWRAVETSVFGYVVVSCGRAEFVTRRTCEQRMASGYFDETECCPECCSCGCACVGECNDQDCGLGTCDCDCSTSNNDGDGESP